MSRKSNETLHFERIIADYAPSGDIFSEDEHVVRRCKRALAALSESDRELFILYAETGSIRKVAHCIGMSPSTAHYKIGRIRKKLKKSILNQ